MKNERGGNEKPTWSAGVAGGEGLGITLALEDSLLFLSIFYLLSLLASSVMCSLILLPRVCSFSLSSLSSLVLIRSSVSLRRNRGIIVLLFGLVLLGYSLVLSVCLFPGLSSFSNGFFFSGFLLWFFLLIRPLSPGFFFCTLSRFCDSPVLLPCLCLCPVFSVQDEDNGGKSTRICCWLRDQNFPRFCLSSSLSPVLSFSSSPPFCLFLLSSLWICALKTRAKLGTLAFSPVSSPRSPPLCARSFYGFYSQRRQCRFFQP